MKVSKSDQQGDSGIFSVGQKINDELGWIFREQPKRDYGIDAHAEVVENGETRGQLLALQIKSGPSWFKEQTDEYIIYRGDEEHREYWMDFPLPVLVILYEPETNTAYWQIVNEKTVVSTGKGWKLEIPCNQTVCTEQKQQLRNYCEFPLSPDTFSITEQKDMSFGLAKRYSADIILNRDMSRGEIAQIINHMTEEVSHSNYYRSHLVERHWKTEKAHVVWLSVYLSLEDMKNTNWICQSQWVDPDLDPKWGPGHFSGMHIGNNLIVNWSENYEFLSKLHKDNTLKKDDYLKQVQPLLDNMRTLANEIIELTNQYFESQLSEKDYLRKMKRFEKKMSKLDDATGVIGFAPIECKDFDVKFKGIMCYANNLVICFSERGLQTWDRQGRENLVKMNIRDYTKELPELEYEYKKIH